MTSGERPHPSPPATPSPPGRGYPANRRISLDPADPAFYQDPYAAFAQIRAVAPVFFWEELGLWCLLGFDAVNDVFRDRRFGREVLHVATREELGLAEPPEHVRPFYEVDNLSMLAREPPAHTRLPHPGQPRLRVAADRAAQAAHRRPRR